MPFLLRRRGCSGLPAAVPKHGSPVALGAGALLYSLFTDYELGVVRRIPMPVHLGLDLGSGLLLAVSPWLFGFAAFVWVPHLVFGLLEVGAALMTKRMPSSARQTRPTQTRPMTAQEP